MMNNSLVTDSFVKSSRRNLPGYENLHIPSGLICFVFILLFIEQLNSQTTFPSKSVSIDIISKEVVYDIFQDQIGFIWLAAKDGIKRYDGSEIKIFDNKKYLSGSAQIISGDSTGKIWIGTNEGSLIFFDRVKNSIKKIDQTASAGNRITAFHTDSKSNIWIGTSGDGLFKIDALSGNKEVWKFDEKSDNSIISNSVTSITEDNSGVLWIGTSKGLNIFNPRKKDSGFLSFSGKQGLNSRINYILKSKLNENIIWIFSDHKLLFYNCESKEFSSVVFNASPDFRKIQDIAEENANNDPILWISTASDLIRADIKDNTLEKYPIGDIIDNDSVNQINSIMLDRDNALWIASNRGFFRLPLKYNKHEHPIVITDFQVFNKSILPGNNSPIDRNIEYASEIKLSNTQNLFSFQFSALNYASPRQIKYAYKMEGFDDEWIIGGTRNFVTYTNLAPGEYIFNVTSFDGQNIWKNNIASIKIIISPPWWQTPWAISIYIIIFILGFWGIVKFQINRTHLRHELKMREFESRHLREIENLKSRFFANLSHEFRTPLMLIKGPLEQLINGRIKNNLSECYKMLLKNTEKLQQLIDELLELSQLESETIPLHKQQHDLVKTLSVITDAFLPLAGENNINLSFTSDVKSLVAMIDRDKLEKIINNLLNNAFKFTPDSGKISVELSLVKQEKTDVAKISISDTGLGIPEEHRSKIFDRFYQIDNVSRRNYGSSGIGLALVKELVSLHNWNISVFSKVGEGTIFTLRIPIEKQIEPETKKTVPVKSEKEDKKISSYKTETVPANGNGDGRKSHEKPVVLFVEDSPDVRDYVCDLLTDDYEVICASKAEQGLELAVVYMPDLIISDIMMEGMDGIEFCKKIKTDWQSSHIPVILLTAKATKESRIEGLATGADDYIIKPFSYEELLIRVKNLIDQRRNLREKFSKEINIQTGVNVSNPVDKDFLNRIYEVLERNLGNEEFDTELLAKEIFVSRRQLHRKIQAVTGQTPGEFIRTFKLRRAAQMLIEDKYNITQIAFEVGFGSPSQFTRAFNKFFGFLPSEFKEKNINKSLTEHLA